jgi:dTDP-4-dehydrorhamnose reductase
MLKVLLLGSTGLLGRAVKAEFEKYDLESPSRSELDVTDFASLESYFSDNSFDFVINCTGYNAVDDAEKPENHEEVFLHNEKVPEMLAKLCEAHNCTLVQFSSDYVFDGENADGYSEDASYDPINVYGQSKMAGEVAVAENCSKYFVIRISWLFGPGKDNFVTTMLNLAKDRDVLTVVNDQFGKPTYTKDIALALHGFTESSDYGIYHLPNEDAVSWYEFAQEIFEIADVEIEVNPVPSSEFKRLAKRPGSSILINSKTDLLRSHKEALADYINNYL